MKQDLIRRFLDVFEETYELRGRADLPAMCFDWMEHTYCNGDSECCLWKAFYESEDEFIKATVEEFNNLHIGNYLDAMVKDIGYNLIEIQSPEIKEIYLINLLIPLREFISEYSRYEKYIDSSDKKIPRRDY